MNNEQVARALLSVRKTTEPFTVVMSGKKSGKVNGLYKPASREIILHNKNFTSDNELMYTALHEYAHHIQFTSAAAPLSVRTHTTAFWSLFHSLLFEAEKKGVYTSPFDGIEEFRSLTREIKEKFITASGSLMKDFGRLLLKAHELCDAHGASFTDYIDRVLGLPRASAQTIMKANSFDLEPEIGFENMRTLAGIRDDRDRAAAQKALMDGQSPDMVKMRYSGRVKPDDAREALVAERGKVERTIKRLKTRLADIDARIQKLDAG
jgi:hypothetical protein